MLMSDVPQDAQLERQGMGEEGVCLVAKNAAFFILYPSVPPVPTPTKSYSTLKGFEKFFNKETYLNLFNSVFPKHPWSQNPFFSGTCFNTWPCTVVHIMVSGILVLEY